MREGSTTGVWRGHDRHRVVDLSADVAGGFCSKLLALQGAEVVRPVPPPTGDGWLATYLHAHKRSVPGVRSVDVTACLARANLVVTSFDGGGYAFDWDDARVRSAAPGAVHLTTSPFGTTGPYRGWLGGTLVDWAAGGYLYITGEPEREPLAGPSTLCGYVTGYTAAVAALAALLRWRLTGCPTRIDVSVMESMLAVHQSTFSRLGAGVLRTRTGRFTELFPLVVEPCRDGYVSLGVVLDEEFDRLAIAMEQPELAVDPRFSSQAARWEHMEMLDGILVAWLRELGADEVVGLLQSHGIAAAKVADVKHVLESPQLAARSFWDTALGPGTKMPGNPVRSAGLRAALWAKPVHADPPAGIGPSPPPAGGSAGPGMDSSGLPLAGPPPVMVLDLTAYWAGPSACRNLADLGARVIRVERPGSRVDFIEGGDQAEVVGRLFDLKTNRGKESVVLDLKTSEGRDVFCRLAAVADVLIENHRAGAMTALGLGPDELTRLNPRLVYVSLNGFGSTGPWAQWRSYGPTIEAASSIEDRTRYPGGPPLRLGHTLPDGVGGLAGTLAALAGLDRREATGIGSYFDVSQLETYIVLSGEEILEASATQRSTGSRTRSQHRRPADEPGVTGVFRCKGDDAWVAVAADSPETYCRLEALLDASGGGPDLVSRITNYTVGRTKEDITRSLQEAGVPAFAAANASDLVSDPQLAARRFFIEVMVGDRRACLPGSPLHGMPALTRPAAQAPRFGEHTATVLIELAGVDDAEVDRLRAADVVHIG